MIEVPTARSDRPSPAGIAEPAVHDDPSPVLEPGKTCWRIAEADRAAVLIDAESYYAALEDAFGRAKQSIMIVGW